MLRNHFLQKAKRNDPWLKYFDESAKGHFSSLLLSNIIGYLAFLQNTICNDSICSVHDTAIGSPISRSGLVMLVWKWICKCAGFRMSFLCSLHWKTGYLNLVTPMDGSCKEQVIFYIWRIWNGRFFLFDSAKIWNFGILGRFYLYIGITSCDYKITYLLGKCNMEYYTKWIKRF